MKTADPIQICPYTGLRSFSEEESLYFKGRDLQIDQLTALLEKNKFLMVTGASGEGKSSIIYAGLIPNARAGFFKARFSNWIVADFRPERNPVTNMAIALAGQLSSSPASVETELRRGFSSLIDLYTNSPFYIDGDGSSFEELSEPEKRDKKRKAANLLILVDQFEEFFTNPENFHNEIPSKDSQIVVNLILETARIAIRDNLPVYVVCTMRSDYIGQCSTFRGLPEYIGFSQFFVPRLKRIDLKQVIEVPAILSGNRITQRLIERLVFDISDGVDQLPILQHALSRIWVAADQGREEMDLIHYAMVGGMPKVDLPDENMPRFHEWFNSLPRQHQNFYVETGLSKIIEIHANLLYENACEYYNGLHPEYPLAQKEAKRIIALTFSCLTKIDNSRAVRNRMNLAEITGVINSPRLTTEIVGQVLNIYREEGNSFIRPFITDPLPTHELPPETVLDITHESLIRNWNKLNQWANNEFEFYSTFLDFRKQLDRWKKSGKSRGYLLPIGPLTYFENWYNKCKPNTHWIQRYGESSEDQEAGRAAAEETLKDTREFLKRSARKVMVTRAFTKYGPRKIATAFAILSMLVLSGIYWYDADIKKNDRVIEQVRMESLNSLKSKNVSLVDKAIYLLAEERFNNGSLIHYLQSQDPKTCINLSIEVYKQLLNFDKHAQQSLKGQLILLVFKNLDSSGLFDSEFQLMETNKFLILLAMDQYYMPEDKKAAVLATLQEKNYNLALTFFRNKNLFRADIPFELNMGIQMWLTMGSPTPDKVRQLLNSISPLAGKESESAFNVYYPKGSFEPNGRHPINFNGGFHTLASLYAAMGDIEHVIWCFQKLLDNNERNYFELPRILNNHLNILGYLYQFGHRDQVPALLNWMNTNTAKNPPITVLRNAVIRSGYISHMYLINIEKNYYRATSGYLFPNLFFCTRSMFDSMMEDYEKAIQDIPDVSQRNFTLAMNQKRKAMFYDKYWFDRQMPEDSLRLNGWLNRAMELYSQLDSAFLQGKESATFVYNGDGVRTVDVSRKDLFIYPDYREGWFSWSYHTAYFFSYLQKNDLLKKIYKTSGDLQSLHGWVVKAYEYKTDIPQNSYSNNYPLSDEILKNILSFVDQHPDGREFDRNLFYLVLANHAFEKGDTTSGIRYYLGLDLQNIIRSSDRYEYLEKIFFLNMMKELCIHLASIGMAENAITLTEKFSQDNEKAFSYIQMSEKVYNQNANPLAFVFLDSLYSKDRKINFPNLPPVLNSRYSQIRVLSEIGSKDINQDADQILREIPEEGKYRGTLARVMGIAGEGNYYRALTSIPNSLTESQDLQCLSMILLEASRVKERSTGNTEWIPMDDYFNWTWNYINYLPS